MHWVSVVVLHCMVWNRKHSESLKNGFKNEKKKGYKQGETVSTCPNLLNSLERIKFRITLIPITGEKPYSSLITSIEYWKFPNLIIFPVPPTRLPTNSIGQCSPRANEQTKSLLSEIAGFFSAWKRSIERKFPFHRFIKQIVQIAINLSRSLKATSIF